MTADVHSKPSWSQMVAVEGGHPLRGTVSVSGFKHSLVTVIAAAVATNVVLELDNCPDITETRVLGTLIEQSGGSVARQAQRLTVDPSQMYTGELDEETSGAIHGAPYLAPALLHRFGKARICVDGGCRIGSAAGGRRPSEHYVDVLQRFGAAAEVTSDGILLSSARGLTGCDIDLLGYTGDRFGRLGNLYSGATKMALLAASVASGTTVLRHPYPKADVRDLILALRNSGATVDDRPDGAIVVIAPSSLSRPARLQHTLLSDVIETVTWVAAGATAAEEPFTIRGTAMRRVRAELRAEFEVFERMGIQVEGSDDAIVVYPPQRLRPVTITVNHRASIFSDSQPFVALLAAHAVGDSSIVERVWPDRFAYVPELNRLGTGMKVAGSTLSVAGPRPPAAAGFQVHGADLRAAAVLVLAALTVPGRTLITGAEHLDRGYSSLIASLAQVGAKIATLGPNGSPHE
ncbi:hypothetical protein [Streptomyces sp. NPDC059893]|uniref:hypothetical protein n=1 Tax=Streptomyces sp. NPDC059893 TaxID=3346990 RepID=UPI0036650520